MPSNQTTNPAVNLSPGSHSCLITDQNGCKTNSQPVIITEPPAIFADAGPDTTICVGNSYTLLAADTDAGNNSAVHWTHNGDGILVNDNTLTPTYNSVSTDGSTVTLTLTAIGISPCPDATDDMVITLANDASGELESESSITICV